MAKNTKQTDLDKLKAKLIQDKVSPELAKQAKSLVFGEGRADAEIVFIGEAPGKNEDLQGRPFIGAAGQFLSEMLEGINLKREDVYITSILKYRPPNNREPLPAEKAAFMPYLQAQLEIIQPKLVVALGRHSLNCFLPDLSISKVHGQPKRLKLQSSKDTKELIVVLLPLFHPAAALYNSSMKQTLIDDFAKIPEIMKQIK